MSDAEIRKNPCGNDKEIDEYLNGTTCEMVPGEEVLNDIDVPADEEFEVDEKAEPEEIEDEYVGKL
ncbi:MAG TPA: hypothetical protein VM577_15130 [Anaerovoracaceae bacterium]|nr:hypothetical protein [Anaerovoracaceae bacterium]